MQLVTKNSPLHRRAAAILAIYGDQLQDQSRSDDLVFLNATVRRHRVFGNAKEQQRLDEIEAEFPLSDIQLAQLDPDVNCVVIPQREQRITQPG